MLKFLYLALTLGALLPLLMLSLCKWRGVFVRKSIFMSFVLVSLPFVAWDVLATKLGYWSFNSVYTTGIQLLGLPIEEILFFFAIPFACLYVWEWLVRLMEDSTVPNVVHRSLFAILCMCGVGLLIYGGWYSCTIGILLIISGLILDRLQWIRRKRFWSFQLGILLLFFVFNTILTLLPIVSYGPDFIIGVRLGTIPLEDFAYNFVLINMSLVVYDYFGHTRGSSKIQI